MSIYRTSQRQDLERVACQASEWLQVMKGTPSAADRTAFAAWVTAAPIHLRELLMAVMLERELSEARVLQDFDVDAIVAEARAARNVVPLRGSGSSSATALTHCSGGAGSQRRAVHWRRSLAVACVVLAIGAMAGLGVWRLPTFSGLEYATAVGEQRMVELPDGTIVAMRPRTRFDVDFSNGVRNVYLLDGEANFAVTHDKLRPFRVHAGTSTIRAVGTQFSVNRLPSGTLVSVTEGKVEVTTRTGQGVGDDLHAGIEAQVSDFTSGAGGSESSGPMGLVAGEALRISSDGSRVTRMTVDPVESEAQSRTQRLTFHDDTLADIAEEFNRYNATRILINDSSVRKERYSGVFDVDDPESFLQFIDCCSSLTVTRQGNQFVIGARQSPQLQDN